MTSLWRHRDNIFCLSDRREIFQVFVVCRTDVTDSSRLRLWLLIVFLRVCLTRYISLDISLDILSLNQSYDVFRVTPLHSCVYPSFSCRFQHRRHSIQIYEMTLWMNNIIQNPVHGDIKYNISSKNVFGPNDPCHTHIVCVGAPIFQLYTGLKTECLVVLDSEMRKWK